MKKLSELYQLAEKNQISVDLFSLKHGEAMSFMDTDGSCYIALDPAQIHTQADERTKLAHELGHCTTGAFYNQYSPYDCRQRHENTADKWAVRTLVPEDALVDAVAEGRYTPWELAEYFGISEALMKKAMCLYTHGNLVVDLYF